MAVIALRNAGIENVVCMLEGAMPSASIARRTLLAMTKTVVCGFDNDGSAPVAADGFIEVWNSLQTPRVNGMCRRMVEFSKILEELG